MTYNTSLDSTAKGVTIGVTILFASIIIGQYSIIKNTTHTTPVYTNISLLLIYFIAFAFRPINYKVSADQLIVHRLFTDIKIDRNHIESVELLNKEKLGWTIRTFGVGGLFGYYGKFNSSAYGNMTWYATRRNKTVLIKTSNNKNIILTPDEPEKFVENLIP
ncbi:PH domain-containing protein [Pedobacter sp. ASV28]|uniref:PH domain-containing protein n=1 Tax=Pedobacter sp. ASV28 TaxID=2795123 RepID=UPI0018EC012B|nr:PH domain-containing protein [Pedobacter sp. ASV28]